MRVEPSVEAFLPTKRLVQASALKAPMPLTATIDAMASDLVFEVRMFMIFIGYLYIFFRLCFYFLFSTASVKANSAS